MSLTSLLSNPEIRKKFSDSFPKPKTTLEGEIKSSPQSKRYMMIGTAFDYLVRFYIEHKYPNTITRKWIAYQGLEQLKLYSGKYTLIIGGKTPKLVLNDEEIPDRNKSFDEELDIGRRILSDAEKNYFEYMANGKITRQLIKSTIELCSLDGYYRSGHWDAPVVDDKDIDDLQKLINIFIAKKTPLEPPVYLNPMFGEASKLVGGADADLIIGDTLIDIKTTKDLKFTQSMYSQLIGYYLLTKIGKINDSKKVKINNIGIYFSRHGVLHVVPISIPESQTNMKEFVEWFEKTAKSTTRKKRRI